MSRLDRYIIRLILGPFLIFVLIFTGVIWLTQSLRIIDTIVNNGQSAWVFIEFTGLLLPMVLAIVLPIATFAATLFTYNRLVADSELVVMTGAGMSGFALARPAIVFAVAVMMLTHALTLYGMPTAQRAFRDRITEIRGDVAAAFIREGQFQSPISGVTVYLRKMGGPGEMFGVFVQDERDPEQSVTYTAERAVLVRDGDATRLLMFDGMAQAIPTEDHRSLSILRFERLAYDLSEFSERQNPRARKPSELYLPRLLTITAEEAGGRSLGDYRAEAHEALSGPIWVVVLSALAVGFLISSSYRRQGLALRILIAAAAAVGFRVAGLAAKSAVSSSAIFWPLIYLPLLAGLVLAVLLLSGRAGVRARRRRAGA